MDLGTSACKFLLVDETGKVCNQVSREYPLSMPHTGWSEQDPSSWWQACLDGIPALLEVYATTLHYAPCHTDPANGFKVLVALPKGTNTDKPNMPIKGGDDAYLWACSVTARATSAPTSPGEVLPVATRSFGGIGIFAIPEMGRFYRHVLIQKRYPHHGAVAFGHYGKALFEVFKFLGIGDIAYNQPDSLPYPTENPWG